MTDLCSLAAPTKVLATACSCAPTNIPPLLALLSAPDACTKHGVVMHAALRLYQKALMSSIVYWSWGVHMHMPSNTCVGIVYVVATQANR